MKSPVTAIEVRWRIVGSTMWETQRFPPSQSIELPDVVRGADYEVEARSIGVPGAPSSEWVSVETTMRATVREGAAAMPPVAVGSAATRWSAGTTAVHQATDS